MNINVFNEENKSMKKSTKIILIFFVLITIVAVIMSRIVLKGVKLADGAFAIDFDTKTIITLVLIALSGVLGFVLYIKFILSLTIDKMLFFTTLPLVALYGAIVYGLARISTMKGEFANKIRQLLNITEENSYNAVLWTVLISVILVVLLFLNYIIICRPIKKVEKVVSRLGDGMVKEGRFNIGKGKQFSEIEHGLNKINNSFKESENFSIDHVVSERRSLLKPYVKALGRNTIINLQEGREIEKRVTLMYINLTRGKDFEESLEENFDMINSYFNLISPLVKKFSGFIDRYSNEGIIAVFSKNDNAIECSHAISKAIKGKNKHGFSFGKLIERISIDSSIVKLSLTNKDGTTRPYIVKGVKKSLKMMDEICHIFSTNIVFSKDILNDLPLSYRFRYRFLGSINAENEKIELFEDLEVVNKRESERLFRFRGSFEKGVISYENGEYEKAKYYFEDVLKAMPNDNASFIYFNKTKDRLSKE